MPHLFLDTERMTNLTSGIGQLSLHLGRELVRQKPADWEMTFLVAPSQVGIFGDSVKYRVATRWNRWFRFWKYDVWHCLHQDTHYYPTRPTRFVYSILDLNYLSLPDYTAARKERRKKQYQECVNQASAITTISAYVAADIRQKLTVSPSIPVQVIYCGVTVPDNPPQVPPVTRPDGPFWFFIGLLQSYKNVHTMLPLLVPIPITGWYWLVRVSPTTVSRFGSRPGD